MEHPGIARVLDAGATAQGKPYFVMELVSGTPIDQYCEKHRLTIRERLELFLMVCHGAHHAHQKGVIHRDLKPSHVLVTSYGGEILPKIIDFGIAKAVAGQRLTDETIYTTYGQFVGTPLYMSPEQTEYGSSNVDARSDVYALGGILYTLLTGYTPIDKDVVANASFEEVRRLIREEDPPRPSVRVLATRTNTEHLANRPETDPARLSRMLRHELDWIVMKALAKDRGGRYQSAGELASDIGRYLKDEPVEARPPRLGPRTARWARRHRTMMWSAGAALGTAVCLVIAAAGLLISQWRRQKNDLELAVNQQRQAKELAALAEINKQAATDRETALREHRDAADLSQAWGMWESGEVRQAEALLTRQIPGSGQIDRRSFAWNYLWSLCRGSYEELHGHDGNVYGVAFSPDGKSLASCGDDRTIVLWDLATRKPRLTLKGHTDDVDVVVFSRDGRALYSGGDDRTVRIWNVADGRLMRALGGFRFGVCQVILHPDGKTLIATDTDSDGDKNGDTSFFDIATGGKLRTIKNQRTLAVSPDGRFLATASPDLAIRLLDSRTLERLAEAWGHSAQLSTAAFSPDGRLLATGCLRSRLRLWEVPGLKPVAELVGHHLQIRGTAFSADGQTLASVGNDGQVLLWDVVSRSLRRSSTDHGNIAWGVAFSPDGQTLATAYRDKTVRLWPLKPPINRVSLVEQPGAVRSVAIMPGGKRFATACGDSRCQVWDIETGRAVGALTLPEKQIDQVAASPAEPLLAMVDSVAAIHVQEWPSGKERPGFTVAPDAFPRFKSLAFMPNGRELATISGNAVVRLWDVHSGQPKINVALESQQGRVGLRWIAPSPGGDLLAMQRVGFLELVDPVSGAVRELSTSAHYSIACVAWSPDGTRIATGDQDQQIELRKQDGSAITVLTGHQGALTALAFSPDGRTLASGSDTGEVFLWCAGSGQFLFPLRGHTGSVLDLAFSPDGTRLLTAGATRSARPWQEPHAWWERTLLLNGGNEKAIRGEVFIWHAPRPAL